MSTTITGITIASALRAPETSCAPLFEFPRRGLVGVLRVHTVFVPGQIVRVGVKAPLPGVQVAVSGYYVFLREQKQAAECRYRS
ncbi:MAG: hypothetical protein HW411_1192 [Gammaproteobacteria bacterium]|nr:hypothetical protein [Gammaproteobacteria bacterium]